MIRATLSRYDFDARDRVAADALIAGATPPAYSLLPTTAPTGAP
jgi:hypothetical protein